MFSGISSWCVTAIRHDKYHWLNINNSNSNIRDYTEDCIHFTISIVLYTFTLQYRIDCIIYSRSF